MDVRNDVLSEGNIEELSILDKTLKKNSSTTRLEVALKRIIDVIASIFGIIIIVPLTIGIWIANRVFGDKGPIFYTQTRIGQNGKKFKIIKYRTMYVDADKKLKSILENDEELKKEWEENRKLVNDPRVTKVRKIFKKNVTR